MVTDWLLFFMQGVLMENNCHFNKYHKCLDVALSVTRVQELLVLLMSTAFICEDMIRRPGRTFCCP